MTVLEAPKNIVQGLLALDTFSEMKIMLLVLDSAGTDEEVVLSGVKIIEKTGLTYPSIDSAVKSLQGKGFLKVDGKKFSVGQELIHFGEQNLKNLSEMSAPSESENLKSFSLSGENLKNLSEMPETEESENLKSFSLSGENLKNLSEMEPENLKNLSEKPLILTTGIYIYDSLSERKGIPDSELSVVSEEELVRMEKAAKPQKREVYSTASPMKKYLTKEVSGYNTVDLCYYFRDAFKKKLNVGYSRISGAERGRMKDLLDNYGAVDTVKAIDYLLGHYAEYITGYPSIAVLYGWRNSVFPAALGAALDKKVSVRESSITKEEMEKGEVTIGEW